MALKSSTEECTSMTSLVAMCYTFITYGMPTRFWGLGATMPWPVSTLLLTPLKIGDLHVDA